MRLVLSMMVSAVLVFGSEIAHHNGSGTPIAAIHTAVQGLTTDYAQLATPR